jgi:BASS family bile acid:Na+ symporter
MTLLPSIAAAAVSAVMVSLGLLLGREQITAALRRRTVLAAVLFAVIVPVPALAVVFVRLAGLTGPVAAGIVLMSISPGAPVALRRAFEVSGRGSIAPALHLAIVILAVVTVPVSLLIMNAIFGVAFAVSPLQVARQVFLAQLLPLGVGVAIRALRPATATWLEPRLARLSNVLLLALLVVCVYALWPQFVELGWMPAVGGAVLTLCALAVGSVSAGRDLRARRQAAIAAAMRNPGLALLITTVNQLPVTVTAAVIAYALGAAVVVTLYVLWQRRRPAD